MSDKTHIEWTDATWNIITGCSVVSAGCKHCYAMKLAGTRLQHHPSRADLTINTKEGPVWTSEVRFNEEWLYQPMQWKRPRKIFVCAHGDLFHESVPDEWIDRVFAVMALSKQHTFQVLTKRARRMREYLRDTMRLEKIYIQWHTVSGSPREAQGWPLPNVWIGVSVEDQAAADERIPMLLQTPAAVRWVSAEPLLDNVTIFSLDGPVDVPDGDKSPIDWVVVGGESGPKARPMHPDWARSLRDQCEAASVAFLMKQWGEWAPTAMEAAKHLQFAQQPTLRGEDIAGTVFGEPGKQFMWPVARVGKKLAGRLLDGVEHNGYPEPRP